MASGVPPRRAFALIRCLVGRHQGGMVVGPHPWNVLDYYCRHCGRHIW